MGRPKSKYSVITTVAYSEPKLKSKIEVFAKTIIGFKLYFRHFHYTKNEVSITDFFSKCDEITEEICNGKLSFFVQCLNVDWVLKTALH